MISATLGTNFFDTNTILRNIGTIPVFEGKELGRQIGRY